MMKKAWMVISLVIVVVFCSISLSPAQMKPDWPKAVTIGAAPVGGVFYNWMAGFAKLLHEKMGITGSVEVTGGPNHNTQLVDVKKIDFAPTTTATLIEAWNGDNWAKGRKYQNSRVIFPMYTTYFQMYALKKSGIKTIHDLNGKSVGVGPVGGGPATYWPMVFQEIGIKPKRMVNAGSSDLNSQFKDGMLDANAQTVGLPWGLIHELEITHDLNIVTIPSVDADKFSHKYPWFRKGIIPKGFYKTNKDYAVETLTQYNYVTVNKDASDDFVYNVVKKVYENVNILIAAHPSAKEVTPNLMAYSPVPIHPGALKYYKEIGAKLPDKYLVQ